MNIYNEIQNPINNDDTLKKIIEIYAKCEERHSDFYKSIVEATNKEHIGQWFPEDENVLFANLFNTWKENIVKITPTNFQKLYGHKGNFNDKDFRELQHYLNGISDISTMEEFEQIMHQEHGNELLDKAIKKYTFEVQQGSLFDKWHYIDSAKLAERTTSPTIHRLYINTDSILTRPLLGEMFAEFEKRQMEYSLKYSENGGRDDTIVIYANDENLQDYIEILREKYEKIQQIRNSMPGYDKVYNIYAPPLMTGVIDGWIGYGTEPDVDENGNNTSYNKVREKLMREAISKSTYEWLYEHKDTKLSFNDGEIVVSQLISQIIAASYLSKAKKILPTSKSQYSSNPEIVDNKNFRNNLLEGIRNDINQELLDINQEKNSDKKLIDIDFGNNTNISFGREDIKNILNRLSVQILNWDSQFLDMVRNKVRELSPKYKIDAKSFCFDTSVVSRLKNSENRETTTNRNKITLSDCIAKIKGLDPEKLSDAYRILEMLELGEIDINKMEEK